MVNTPCGDLQERLHVISDAETGLSGIIAIHSTVLGPAAGGCRLWHYPSQEDLITDAIRLARGMSYKNALAGLPFGGGKAVLLRPEGAFDREALFEAFGQTVERLDGAYITAEDVGTTVDDMRAVRSRTSFVAGLHGEGVHAGGDPSPWTALGVLESMRAAAGLVGLSLRGARVAIQGTGNVGGRLARLLHGEGARLILADIDEAGCAALVRELGASQRGSDEILEAGADILAPCALGAVLNDRTIPKIKAPLICGGANNQLEHERHGEALRARGILYAPDYVVNAGGIINVAAEYLGETTSEVESRVMQIGLRLLSILKEAIARNAATNLIADDLAQQTLAFANRRVA